MIDFISNSFITYRSCKYLDGKHTIFGHVVGGLDTLSAMEKIEVDNKDRPLEDIVILQTSVFSNPYSEVDAEIKEERLRGLETNEEQEEKAKAEKAKPFEYKPVKGSTGSGIGKYLAKRK
jgi:peptidyl-prolyl cis-trans isomerase-like protein 2